MQKMHLGPEIHTTEVLVSQRTLRNRDIIRYIYQGHSELSKAVI
jgi:hypothetical protein